MKADVAQHLCHHRPWVAGNDVAIVDIDGCSDGDPRHYENFGSTAVDVCWTCGSPRHATGALDTTIAREC